MGFQPKTVNGHNLFEVVSALQKSIRRGELDDALYWAVDMDLSGYAGYLWRRLAVISCEDVGLANPTVPLTIYALHQQYLAMVGKSKKHCPEREFIVMAVSLLATSPKSRIVDNAILVHYGKHADLRREIPDYALDFHTQKGRSKKRGVDHFFEEGCRLWPEDQVHEVIAALPNDPYWADAKVTLMSGRNPVPPFERGQKKLVEEACVHGATGEWCDTCGNECEWNDGGDCTCKGE